MKQEGIINKVVIREDEMVMAIRGAIKVSANEKNTIYDSSVKLLRAIVNQNNIKMDQIISIICSLTQDLSAGNPATGLRKDGYVNVPLFCVQEAFIEGQLTGVIRLLVTYRSENNLRQFYAISANLDGI